MSGWESKKTDQTREIEQLLRQEFPNTEVYRYNSGTIRVRVIDQRFKGKSIEQRDEMVSHLLDTLPEDIQSEIMLLLTLTPEETVPANFNQNTWVNLEFENPSPSLL